MENPQKEKYNPNDVPLKSESGFVAADNLYNDFHQNKKKKVKKHKKHKPKLRIRRFTTEKMSDVFKKANEQPKQKKIWVAPYDLKMNLVEEYLRNQGVNVELLTIRGFVYRTNVDSLGLNLSIGLRVSSENKEELVKAEKVIVRKLNGELYVPHAQYRLKVHDGNENVKYNAPCKMIPEMEGGFLSRAGKANIGVHGLHRCVALFYRICNEKYKLVDIYCYHVMSGAASPDKMPSSIVGNMLQKNPVRAGYSVDVVVGKGRFSEETNLVTMLLDDPLVGTIMEYKAKTASNTRISALLMDKAGKLWITNDRQKFDYDK